MDVSFQGFSKLGAQRYQMSKLPNKPTDLLIINFKVNNDALGEDFYTFNELLQERGKPLSENINLKLWKYKKNPFGPFNENRLCLNGDYYELNEENKGVFEIIAQFLNKVILASDEYIKTNQNDISVDYCTKNFIVNLYKENHEIQWMDLFSCENIKEICKDMLDTISKDFSEYMEV